MKRMNPRDPEKPVNARRNTLHVSSVIDSEVTSMDDFFAFIIDMIKVLTLQLHFYDNLLHNWKWQITFVYFLVLLRFSLLLVV